MARSWGGLALTLALLTAASVVRAEDNKAPKVDIDLGKGQVLTGDGSDVSSTTGDGMSPAHQGVGGSASGQLVIQHDPNADVSKLQKAIGEVGASSFGGGNANQSGQTATPAANGSTPLQSGNPGSAAAATNIGAGAPGAASGISSSSTSSANSNSFGWGGEISGSGSLSGTDNATAAPNGIGGSPSGEARIGGDVPTAEGGIAGGTEGKYQNFGGLAPMKDGTPWHAFYDKNSFGAQSGHGGQYDMPSFLPNDEDVRQSEAFAVPAKPISNSSDVSADDYMGNDFIASSAMTVQEQLADAAARNAAAAKTARGQRRAANRAARSGQGGFPMGGCDPMAPNYATPFPVPGGGC